MSWTHHEENIYTIDLAVKMPYLHSRSKFARLTASSDQTARLELETLLFLFLLHGMHIEDNIFSLPTR
jgi:hypothetical protein